MGDIQGGATDVWGEVAPNWPPLDPSLDNACRWWKQWHKTLFWHVLIWLFPTSALVGVTVVWSFGHNVCDQVRNQLGTPGGAKSFPRGAQIFWTMSNIFKLCPTHFSRWGENFLGGLRPPAPPWLRACLRLQPTTLA